MISAYLIPRKRPPSCIAFLVHKDFFGLGHHLVTKCSPHPRFSGKNCTDFPWLWLLLFLLLFLFLFLLLYPTALMFFLKNRFISPKPRAVEVLPPWRIASRSLELQPVAQFGGLRSWNHLVKICFNQYLRLFENVWRCNVDISKVFGPTCLESSSGLTLQLSESKHKLPVYFCQR